MGYVSHVMELYDQWRPTSCSLGQLSPRTFHKNISSSQQCYKLMYSFLSNTKYYNYISSSYLIDLVDGSAYKLINRLHLHVRDRRTFSPQFSQKLDIHFKLFHLGKGLVTTEDHLYPFNGQNFIPQINFLYSIWGKMSKLIKTIPGTALYLCKEHFKFRAYLKGSVSKTSLKSGFLEFTLAFCDF